MLPLSQIVSAAELVGTPCYVCSWEPVATRLSALEKIDSPLPLRHWLSFKTHPVKSLLSTWRSLGLSVEVVSEFEFAAALQEGFPPASILVNGPLKHTWLPAYRVPGIRVHFDSVLECRELLPQSRDLNWQIGLRIHTRECFDPDDPDQDAQFGMTAGEAEDATVLIRGAGVSITSLHFHLRSHLRETRPCLDSLIELASVARHLHLSPIYVDIGGGLPNPSELIFGTNEPYGDLAPQLSDVLKCVPALFPSAQEIWMESGAYLTGSSAVLVTSVCDVKVRDSARVVLCDGGRTNHALVSDWESHRVLVVPVRSSQNVLTTVAGPSCMAFDHLVRMPLPEDVTVGDRIIWTDAGAYHIPWETRFSRGLCPVVWIGRDGNVTVARKRESPTEWWGQWE
jgi:diaminopimelate decarboxylase